MPRLLAICIPAAGSLLVLTALLGLALLVRWNWQRQNKQHVDRNPDYGWIEETDSD